MAEETRLVRPVEIVATTKEAVAFQLMETILKHEDGRAEEKKKRDFWLKLYGQCLRATSGLSIEPT